MGFFDELAALVEALPDAATILERDTHRVLAANGKLAALCCLPPYANAAFELFSAEDAAALVRAASHAPSWTDLVLAIPSTLQVKARASSLHRGERHLVLVVLRPGSTHSAVASASTLREVIAQLPIGVLLAEPHNPNTVLLNSACAQICGVPIDDLHRLVESDRTWQVRRLDDAPIGDDDLPTMRALHQGETSGPEDLILIPANDSAPKLVSAHTVPVRNAAGDFIAAVTTVVDVTRFREAERAIHCARENAEREARRKGAFYASLSREIRSPLTSILGYVDLIADPETPPKDREDWCHLVRRSGDVLMGLIQDLVDLGQMEASTFKLNRAPMAVGLVLAEVLSVIRTRAQRRGIDVAVRYTTPIPRSLTGDAARLRQTLTTLLSFGVDNADHGDVTLQVAMIGTPHGRRLAFDIAARCRALTSEDLEALIDPFKPASPGSRAWSLAFPLASRLAAMMGGSIESKCEGQRLQMRLTIAPGTLGAEDLVPMHASTDEDNPPSSLLPPRMRGRVLLVEDNDDDRMLVTRLLERSGLRVEAVASGYLALELEAAEFDVVLMDVELPGMDGLETTQRLREAGATVPIVAVTAAALDGDRERCLAAGCTAYVSKPIDRLALLHALNDLLSTSEDKRIMSELPAELRVLEPLRSTREDDPSVRDVLWQFAERAARYVDHIARSITAGDREGAERAARTLAGTAGSYGFEPLHRASVRLADACKQGSAATSDLQGHTRALNDVMQRVRAAYPPRMPSIPPSR